jgi:hypothetical protein
MTSKKIGRDNRNVRFGPIADIQEFDSHQKEKPRSLADISLLNLDPAHIDLA